MQSTLNPEQQLAVEHGKSPLLVIAGAGSGKTNTLAHRLARLVSEGADPGRIMLLTFSRRAAEEMKRRAADIAPAARLSWSGTFHGIGARLLREYAGRIGLNPSFTIHDREDSSDLMNMMRHRLGLSEKEKRFPLKNTCLSIYSSSVNTTSPLEAMLQRKFPWCSEWHDELKRLFLAYVEEKQKENVLDYDDLLLYWAEMLKLPSLAAEMGERFTHVLVDEYQDTNLLQAAILLGMKPDGCGLTVVGDDAQSIYAFRGAEIRNILDFPGHFDPPARIVKLERNYRSTRPILDAANGVIGLAQERYSKTLRSERHSNQKPCIVSVKDESDQASFVIDDVLEKRESGVNLKSQAVLFRAAHHSAALEI
ncbi:MAG TPA: ATP-dependent helicase, partial [Burkholderiales bacterium]|nr:ATP-dependent helicase [Burkholderiales bacterium]